MTNAVQMYKAHTDTSDPALGFLGNPTGVAEHRNKTGCLKD